MKRFFIVEYHDKILMRKLLHLQYSIITLSKGQADIKMEVVSL